MGRNKVVVVLAAVMMVAGVALGTVTKTTTKTPPSFSQGLSGSSIGVAHAFQGPGAIAGTTAAAFSVVSGSLSKSAEGSHTVNYDATGGSNYRLLTTAVVGISFSYAKKISFLWWSGGSMTSSNTIGYAVTESTDGDTVVVLSGAKTTTADSGGVNKQFKPLFKFYGTLVNFSTNASLTADVTSTSTITASPISTGIATGHIAGYVLGIP